jgi:hypothetical protein
LTGSGGSRADARVRVTTWRHSVAAIHVMLLLLLMVRLLTGVVVRVTSGIGCLGR